MLEARPLLVLRCPPARKRTPMILGTLLGKTAIAAGYLAFIGFAGGGLILLRAAQAQYRSGQSDMNPLACIAVATTALLVYAHVRALALP